MSKLIKNKIGLFGFGVVGKGFYHFLSKSNQDGLLDKIAIKNYNKERIESKLPFTSDKQKILSNNSINTVVELIDGTVDAYEIIKEALIKDKNVVSANKKIIALNLAEFIALENKSKGTFLYEGAVCGSIPVLGVLNDWFGNVAIQSLSGILNGTSNYILTQIFEKGQSYNEALKKAQELGFAELNPTSDVEGYDSVYKLTILILHAFGVIVHPNEILNIGIQNINSKDVDFANKYGLKIKLIAHAEKKGNKLNVIVAPQFVSGNESFYKTDNEYNGVLIETEEIGNQFFKGKGAGSLPTGSVVFNDVEKIKKGIKYNYSKLNNHDLTINNNRDIDVLITLPANQSPANVNLNFKSIISLENKHNQYIAQISYKELLTKKNYINKSKLSIVVIKDKNLIKSIFKSLYNELELIA